MIKDAKQTRLQRCVAATMLPYAQAVQPFVPPKPNHVKVVSFRKMQGKAEWWQVRVANRRIRENLKRGELHQQRVLTAKADKADTKRSTAIHITVNQASTFTPTVEQVKEYLRS